MLSFKTEKPNKTEQVAEATEKVLEFECATADYKAMTAAWDARLEHYYSHDEDFAAIRDRMKELHDLIQGLQREVEESARTLGTSLYGRKIRVEFSDPVTRAINGKLLWELCPDAMDDALVKEIKVDQEIFDSYVGLGKIPTEVVDRVARTMKTTKRGRIQFK